MADPVPAHGDAIEVEVLARRRDRICRWLRESGAAAVVAYSSAGPPAESACHLRYLTGWSARGPAVAVLTSDGHGAVLTRDLLDARVGRVQASWFGAVTQFADGVGTAVRAALVDGGLAAHSIVVIAGASAMSHVRYAELCAALGDCELWVDDGGLEVLRLTKDPREVDMLQAAAEISDSMVRAAMVTAAHPGVSGADVMTAAEYAGRRSGARLATCWLATGPSPATTHFELWQLAGAITHGDRVQLGTTVNHEGYFGQSVRTAVRGRPPAPLLEFHRALCDVQDAALATMIPGAPLRKVAQTIELGIDQCCPYQRHDDPFRFQSCHGLGLSYSEPAMADALNVDRDGTSARRSVLMEENMVIEIHPNFSVPGLGHLCVGDMAVVTAAGGRWMTEYERGVQQL